MGKLSRDRRDIYYRRAKQEGYRARSAYKLLQVDQYYPIFKGVNRAVDLCAAPGSWSQVLSQKLNCNENNNALIVSVDLQDMAPIEGVNIIKGDITSQNTVDIILDYFGGEKADLVLCDGAPDVTGFHDIDEFIQNQLLLSALSITTKLLCDGGSFVAKIFRGENIAFIYQQMFYYFEYVDCCKPASSRNSSLEAFIVCRNFNSTKLTRDLISDPFSVPFIACGDLSINDPDRTYETNYSAPLQPVQLPINAPYERNINSNRGIQ
ncbi:tRNA-methyltransferase protein [Cryptosporidium andersoni]|uniref:Putative tRNA (cytidine(32)/guanosine(34)-2'-O)-methyltransferase n=1 Tax=Cryptosporidium andersoni TaxID=117008 RepID=A0A1J4MUH6_9CRYT|nr:tRNA-methyltransferase protein [Cryptosporidium andersoni]